MKGFFLGDIHRADATYPIIHSMQYAPRAFSKGHTMHHLIENPFVCTSMMIGQLVGPASSCIESVTSLVNEAYSLGESGMWVDGASRTNVEEIKDLILQKRIIVAVLEHELLGSIKITRQDNQTLEFGQLAVSKKALRNGVGKQLIQYAESHARKEGFLKIKLEILYPAEQFEKKLDESESIDMHDPSVEVWKKKALLHKIYTQMNYQKIHVGDMSEFAQDYPQLVDSLAIPCKYVVYEKLLDN